MPQQSDRAACPASRYERLHHILKCKRSEYADRLSAIGSSYGAECMDKVCVLACGAIVLAVIALGKFRVGNNKVRNAEFIVVATIATGLGSELATLLKRFADEPIVFVAADSAAEGFQVEVAIAKA